MANEKNLEKGIKINSEEMARKYQKKSVESRNRNTNMQNKMDAILNMALKIGDVPELDEIQSIAELNGMNMDVETAICLQQALKALKKQDTKAAEFCRDTSGQKPVEKVEMATIDQSVIDEVERMVFSDDDTETSN